jgi:hypothetical protein
MRQLSLFEEKWNESTKNPGRYMAVYGGHKVYLDNPVPSDFQPVRSAYGLSHECRYGGNYGPYSVAQHSVLVAEVVRLLGGSPLQQLAGLMHDASEAVLGDMPSPVKSMCPDFRELERRLEGAINARYGIDVNDALVKEADRILFCAEIRYLIPESAWHLYMPYGDVLYRRDLQPDATDFIFWSPDEARKTFLSQYETIMKAVASE